MKLKNFLKETVVGSAILLFISCGSVQTIDGYSSNDSDDSFNDSLLSGVTEIEFGSDNTAVVGLDGINESDTYIVALYSYDESNNSTYSYQLGGSGNLVSSFLKKAETGEDITEDFHQKIRRLEAAIDDADPVNTPSVKALTRAATVGSLKTFKVMNSLSSASSYDVVTAKLRYATSNFYAYVDVRNEDALTDDDLEEVLGAFDDVVDNERNLFGEESDVNGDGHFVILMSQAVNELGASGGGIITGYFYAVDLFSSASYSISNQMEIFYTMVPDPSGAFGTAVSKGFSLSNILPAVLPHEFQHMISYNQHVFENHGSSEVAWLNEGFSHLAEDIYSLNGNYMEETGIDNPARVAYYLNSNDEVCFTCGSSLSQRGGSYLFVRYLYEQAELGNLSEVSSGADLLNRLLDTDLTGVDNILDAALDTSSDDGFRFLLGRFSLALYLSATGLTDDTRYQFNGISLRGLQDDNRGTVLDGPTVEAGSLPYNGTVVSSGISFTSITGTDVINAGSELPVAISGDMQGGGYLIELNAL